MKIAIHSDLHHEGYRLPIGFLHDQNFDVLVLAGDIISARTFDRVKTIRDMVHDNKPIIYVPGNHEFYNGTIEGTGKNISDFCLDNGILYASQGCFVIGEVAFICATGWATLESFPQYDIEEKKKLIRTYVRDFTIIGGNGIDDMIERGKSDYSFIESMLAYHHDKKCVVVTHFAPTENHGNDYFDVSPSSSYFANAWEGLMYEYEPVMWIYGHTHYNKRLPVYNTQVVCNQKGYGNECVGDYNPNFIIEI